MTPKLPKEIHVTKTQDGKESYLTAHESLDSIDDGEIVGIYQLIETRRMLVTRQLQWATGKPK